MYCVLRMCHRFNFRISLLTGTWHCSFWNRGGMPKSWGARASRFPPDRIAAHVGWWNSVARANPGSSNRAQSVRLRYLVAFYL